MTLDNLCNDVNSVEQVAAISASAAAVQAYLAANPDDTTSQAAGDRILNATSLRSRRSTVTLEDSVQNVTPGYEDRIQKMLLVHFNKLPVHHYWMKMQWKN